ncbi:MAG: sulfurtransferase [Magnetococcales bacterium]|nr:sulfurtransferase [Magnetococcales bacterium]
MAQSTTLGGPEGERFVSGEWLQANLQREDLRLVQAGGESYYPQLHIPGAALMMPREILTERDGVPGMRERPEVLRALFGRLGIREESRVVVYDAAGGLDASRLVWTLASMGHERAAVLDGGMNIWYTEKRPVTGGPETIPPVGFTPRENPELLASMEEVLRLAEQGGETLLLDTRSSGEYTGNLMRGPRGHIPGALHLDWTESMVDAKNPRLKSREALLARLAQVGLREASQEVILYCQTAHRASQTWVLLRHLGFSRVKLYDGSMAEWVLRQLPLIAGESPR